MTTIGGVCGCIGAKAGVATPPASKPTTKTEETEPRMGAITRLNRHRSVNQGAVRPDCSARVLASLRHGLFCVKPSWLTHHFAMSQRSVNRRRGRNTTGAARGSAVQRKGFRVEQMFAI